jgi:hypothetical protein
VHDAHVPRADRLPAFEQFSRNPYRQRCYAVLVEMDRPTGKECPSSTDAILGLAPSA